MRDSTCVWQSTRKGDAANISYSQSKVCFNTLPNDKILNQSKSKAFTDDKIRVTEELKFGLGRVENIVGKEENVGYQHFLLFPLCFQNLLFPEVLKVRIVWYRVKPFAVECRLNSVPDDKILGWTNLKVFADVKLNVAKMMNSLFDRVESIVGKGENAGDQHFLPFPQCSPKPSTRGAGSLKVMIVW